MGLRYKVYPSRFAKVTCSINNLQKANVTHPELNVTVQLPIISVKVSNQETFHHFEANGAVRKTHRIRYTHN